MLQKQREYGLCRVMFGTSGHEKQPEGGVLQVQSTVAQCNFISALVLATPICIYLAGAWSALCCKRDGCICKQCTKKVCDTNTCFCHAVVHQMQVKGHGALRPCEDHRQHRLRHRRNASSAGSCKHPCHACRLSPVMHHLLATAMR